MIDWRLIATHDGSDDEVLIYDGLNYSVATFGDDFGCPIWFARAGGEDACEFDREIITIKPTHWAPLQPPA